MICPRCGAEYRQGFTSCADCHVLLVAEGTAAAASQRKAWSTWSSRSIHASDAGADMGNELDSTQDAVNVDTSVEGEEADADAEPRGGIGDPNTDPFCSFWRGADLRVCTEICTVLDEAGIAHRTIRREDHLFNIRNRVPYEIGVPASLYEKAENAIREAFGTEQAEVKLLPPQKEDPRAQALQSVWVGDSATDCASLCEELKNAGIPYRVDEQKEIAVRGTIDRYQIEVAEEDYDHAAEITGGFHPEALNSVDDDEEGYGGEEVFAAQDSGVSGSRWVEGNKREQRGEFYPEDATSLVWEGDAESWRGAIEMCLKEFDIPMRCETSDGKEKLYVLPEDEERAKEIMKEVVTGEPTGDDGSGKS